MSSAVPPRPNQSNPAPRPMAPPPSGGSSMPVIDPIKLLKKWKFVLVASVAVGGVLGFIGNFVWARTYPIYDSVVTYEALPPQDASLITSKTIDGDAIEQFMATQADRMLSSIILQRVAEDPRLKDAAPNWSKRFEQSDGTFNYQEAMVELEKRVSARPVGGTYYVRMKVSWKIPDDVAGMARLLREAYMSDLEKMLSIENGLDRATIQTAIDNIKREIQNLTERRTRLIRDEEITGLAEQQTTTRERLSLIARERNNLALELRSMETQLERMNEMVKSEGGIRYSDTQRQIVESSPIVQQMKSNLEFLETKLMELRRTGLMPSHREYKQIENQIAATEQRLSITKERELAKLFDAEKDFLESSLAQSRAQDADMISREEDLEILLQDMTRTITEINDITDQIEAMNQSLASRRSSLEDIQTATSGASASRMVVREPERTADRATLPKLMMMVPLGIILVTGLTSGLILAVEFLDQRVKSPADLAAMPRTKILGTIPLADEDPAVKGHFDTVMRDAHRSVVAESFRQIRTSVLKRFGDNGHRTCMVFSGMPGSGATSVTANLGFACSGVGRNVLIIDANFRRPKMHKLFGLREGPGLGDVLAGDATLDSAVQTIESESGSLHVLTSGSASNRVFERLGTQAMTELLSIAGSKYDITFIDTAPAIVAGDASSLAQRCDASILVTRAFSETRGMVARVKNEFSDTPAELLGVIVNAVRSSAGGYMKRNIKTSTDYHSHDPGAVPVARSTKSAPPVSTGDNAA